MQAFVMFGSSFTNKNGILYVIYLYIRKVDLLI